jgi:hypothetical protein
VNYISETKFVQNIGRPNSKDETTWEIEALLCGIKMYFIKVGMKEGLDQTEMAQR